MELLRQKNVATYIVFPLVDADGDPVSGATGLDSEIDEFSDGAAPTGFVDCTNEATEIGSTGMYYLSLTLTEMNQDYLIIQIKSNEAKTQVILIRTIVGDPLNVATTDDNVAIDASALNTLSGHDPGENIMGTTDLDATLATIAGYIDTEVAAILSDTDEIQQELADGGRLDLLIDAILADTNELQTDDTPAALAAIDAKIDTIDGIVDNILTDTAEIGVAGAGLSAVPWNSAWDAEVESEVTDALNTYDPPTKAEQDAAFTEIKGATWSSGSDTLEHIRDKETDIETDTAEIGVAGAGLTEAGGTGDQFTAIPPRTVEGAIDEIEAMKVLLAFVAGKSDGGGTATIHFRDQADTLNRITLTVDADGNRSATVVNVT